MYWMHFELQIDITRKKATPHHTIIKMQKLENKEIILKVEREKL
jgi:hypothetical protein